MQQTRILKSAYTDLSCTMLQQAVKQVDEGKK
jgi:hypothetical protein